MYYKNILPNKSEKHLLSSAYHINVNCITHLHTNMEIVIVTDGTLTIGVGDKKYTANKDQAIFVPSFKPHSFHSEMNNTCLVLVFESEAVPTFFQFLKLHTPTKYIFNPKPESIALIKALLPKTQHCADILKIQAALSPLCLEIKNQCEFIKVESISEDSFLKALEYINCHFSENILLENVAKAIGLHPVTLSKKFTENANLSFSSYLNYVRCVNAASLLYYKNITVAEVAFSSGFGSIRNFNRAFLKVYGVTPSKYQKTHSFEILPTNYYSI